MIETNKAPNLLTEYVLDLLPPAEKQRLAQQIGADPALRAQVQQERQVGQLVKQTVQQAGQVDNARLARLMPAVPRQKRPFWHNPAVQQAMRQVAMVAMMFILLLGGWQWFNGSQTAVLSQTPTAIAVTATMTHTPTATQTQPVPMETAVARDFTHTPNVIYTPAPLPTPVAGVPMNTN
jgi:anti-sigma factor RsiW